MRRVKIGVIGCGAIAQVHHMPNLTDLQNEFEVTAVCDISAGAAKYLAQRFHVPQHFTDYRDLLASDVEAVLLCQSDPKTAVAIDAFAAGKHVFIEKPICYSLQEADAIIAARRRAGTVGQAGYMKVYDPAFELAKQEVDAMDNVRFVQINHLHPDNALHLLQFHLERFDDIPADAIEALNAARTQARQEAIGEAPPHVELAFHLLSGSMIHDLYGLRTMMGMPERVVSTEIWQEGRGVTLTLAYPNGARCVATWIDLPKLWDFKETLEIYGDEKRVIVSYPTGFSRGILSTVTVQAVDEKGATYRKEPAVDWESAFSRELRHFHQCIVEGTPCRTPLEEARQDISLIIDIVKAYR
jgi:predicted dehydrogenase